MPTPPESKKRMQVQPPGSATHWALWRVTSKHNASNNPGRRDKCLGEPGEDGKVPDVWPVADFSTTNVLAQWGDGKYRVDWYDASGSLLKGQSQLFEVATPASKKAQRNAPRLRPPARAPAVELDEPGELRAAPSAGAGGQIGFLEMLAMLRAEGDAVREREQQAGDRMLQFMMQMQQQQTTLLTTLMGRQGGGGDAELLRRELQQTMREQMFALRQELSAGGGDDEGDEETDGDDPPANLEEAAERIGMAMLGDLEQRAPHLIQEFIPKIAEFFKASGVKPSAALQQRAAAAAAAANGHANRG